MSNTELNQPPLDEDPGESNESVESKTPNDPAGGNDPDSDSPKSSNGKPFATANGKSLGYPTETPWREMSPEEAVNYWMHQSKGWQSKAEKSKPTDAESEALAAANARIAELEAKTLSADEKAHNEAIESAKAAGYAEAEAHYKPIMRNVLLESVATSVIGEDRARKWAPTVRDDAFLTEDGDLDGEAVLAHLKEVYGEPETKTPKPTGVYQQSGQGQPPAKPKVDFESQVAAQLARRGQAPAK